MARIDSIFNSTDELRQKSRISIFIVESRKEVEKLLRSLEDDLTSVSLEQEKLSLKVVNEEMEPKEFVCKLVGLDLAYAKINEEYQKIKRTYTKWFLNAPMSQAGSPQSERKAKPVLKKTPSPKEEVRQSDSRPAEPMPSSPDNAPQQERPEDRAR